MIVQSTNIAFVVCCYLCNVLGCRRPNGWAEVLHCRIEKLKSQKRIEGMSEEEITACHEQFEADVDKEMLHGVRVLIRNAKWGHGKSKPEPKTFHAELAKVKSSRQKG